RGEPPACQLVGGLDLRGSEHSFDPGPRFADVHGPNSISTMPHGKTIAPTGAGRLVSSRMSIRCTEESGMRRSAEIPTPDHRTTLQRTFFALLEPGDPRSCRCG